MVNDKNKNSGQSNHEPLGWQIPKNITKQRTIHDMSQIWPKKFAIFVSVSGTINYVIF